MSDLVIKVEDLGKQYRLGKVGTGSFSHDLNRWWQTTVRGKEDPYLKIGEENDRTKKGESDWVWAIKNINFEVKKGEVLGIIGKNGAGKSTLLKILSRVTGPTTGTFKVKGRIASLLEVGTGFHPDLSGRENIFLNGAVLGMTKREIRSKLDEIIDFSGIERYIDTPVKRYSSGMYVRLAFAVAAHLEPEILIVDEVLAVGDAEFQKKCLGKMKDVTAEGRTVIFVSHNLNAVNSLCSRCLYMKNGLLTTEGNPTEIINQYLISENSVRTSRTWERGSNPGDDVAILHAARLIDENSNSIEVVSLNQKIGIEYIYEVLKDGHYPSPSAHVFNAKGEHAFVSASPVYEQFFVSGHYKTVMWIPENLLNNGTYMIGITVASLNPVKIHFFEKEAIVFEAIEDINQRDTDFNQKLPGVVRPKLNWQTVKI